MSNNTSAVWDIWQNAILSLTEPWSRCCQQQRQNLVIGDTELIAGDAIEECQWLGKVVEAFKSSDNLVRKVKLLTGDPGLSDNGKRQNALKYLERPVQKVILLLESPA